MKYEEYWPKMLDDLLVLVGTPYKLGSEVLIKDWPPKFLDCSELVELVHARQNIPVPDGARYQWKETYCTGISRPGDLAFLRRDSAIRPDNPHGIVHVDMLLDEKHIVGARGKPHGKVVVLPKYVVENNPEFLAAGGWRRFVSLRGS